MLLEGKRVLVTGGSSGLGRNLVTTFACEGARIAFNYSHSDQGAKDTEEAARQHTPNVLSFKASVLDATATLSMVNTLDEEWGGIDVLVNNAGVSQMLPMAMIEEEDWDKIMDTNAKGTYLVTRAVLKSMIRQHSGKILNIGSLAGMRMIESPVHYATSKAAIKGFTESLAKEVGRYGITVNCLAPGLLEGGVGSNLPDYRLNDYLHHCALGRIGTFNEIAELCAFMISDQNTYMTGATLVVDGGL
ncbi:MAG: SDR family oxidoreductase [bacterium]